MPINPRPAFRLAVKLLKDARCPDYGRTFDPAGASEEYAPRIKPLNCGWCSERWRVIRGFDAWVRQEKG